MSVNKKSSRSVHASGALGILLNKNLIKPVDEEFTAHQQLKATNLPSLPSFETQSGLVFRESDLVYVDPRECEPWKYANRLENEMGNLNELVESIRQHDQLQPVLIRPHPAPHDGIKYEIIFGRRRHLACLRLDKSLLAIQKEFNDDQDAVVMQDAENKFRKDISNYSNALLYKKLLEARVFQNDHELAKKLGIARSSLSELLSYTKIPQDIADLIPDIHALSTNMALKIVALLNKDPSCKPRILEVAPQIGKSVTSALKLEQVITFSKPISAASLTSLPAKTLVSQQGEKLCTLQFDKQGAPRLLIEKSLWQRLDQESFLEHVKSQLETCIQG